MSEIVSTHFYLMNSTFHVENIKCADSNKSARENINHPDVKYKCGEMERIFFSNTDSAAVCTSWCALVYLQKKSHVKFHNSKTLLLAVI